MNTGTAYFSGISFEEVEANLAEGGATAEKAAASDADRSRIRALVEALLAVGICLLLWRYLLPPSSRIPP